jgi:hypothetical protein
MTELSVCRQQLWGMNAVQKTTKYLATSKHEHNFSALCTVSAHCAKLTYDWKYWKYIFRVIIISSIIEIHPIKQVNQ